MMTRRTLVLVSLAGLVLAACGGGAPAATKPPASVAPAVTITGPTPTEPPPAITLVGPTTAATAEIQVQPSATAEVAGVIGPDNYPAGINPLTGLPVDDAQLNHRIIAVKVANFPYYIRPQPTVSFSDLPYACQQTDANGNNLTNACAQSGLASADIVFEHYAEGGTTRFTAIFYGQDADHIGPIRSARLVDTILPEMFKAALVASGSSSGVLHRLGAKSWFDLVIAETTGFTCPLLCPQNLHPQDPAAVPDANSIFTSTKALHEALAAKDLDSRQTFRGVAYSAQAPAGGAALNALRVEYSGAAQTEWTYDSASGRYLRAENKTADEIQPQLDGVTKKQLSSANVVVLFVNHVVDFSIPEDFDNDGQTGHFSTEVQLWGSGPAWVLRDGQVYKANWVRQKASDMVGLVDQDNHLIPLKPGNTWYQLVGLTSATVTDGATWLVRHTSPRDKGDIPNAPTLTPAPDASATPTP